MKEFALVAGIAVSLSMGTRLDPQSRCEAGGGVWDSQSRECSFRTACENAGGMWDWDSSKCVVGERKT
jgi:hypothetical protein